jgi:hypothetical protein
MAKFKDSYEFEKRKKEGNNVKTKYPGRIPIIVEVENGNFSKELPILEKTKYLVPHDIKISAFLFILRKKLKLTQDVAVYMYVNNNTMPIFTDTVGHVYEKHKDEDGFLYLTLSGESFFG